MTTVETAFEKGNEAVIVRILDETVLKEFQALKQNISEAQGTTPGNSFQREVIRVLIHFGNRELIHVI